MAERFAIPAVRLVNDLVATGCAVPVLAPGELAVLQAGRPAADGNAALIAPGTGLRRGPAAPGRTAASCRCPRRPATPTSRPARRRRSAARGAHRPLRAGVVRARPLGPRPRPPARRDPRGRAVRGRRPARASRRRRRRSPDAALAERCPRCVDAVDRFAAALGAEAGNLGLRSFATAGVYVGGGIAPRILPRLRSGAFLDAFRAKGPMEALVSDMPVVVIDAPHPAVTGAAVAAAELAAAARVSGVTRSCCRGRSARAPRVLAPLAARRLPRRRSRWRCRGGSADGAEAEAARRAPWGSGDRPPRRCSGGRRPGPRGARRA